MKIHIDRIPDAGLNIAETRPPEWLVNFADLLKGGSETIEKPVAITVRIEKLASQVRIKGEIVAEVKCTCARCAAPIVKTIRAPVDAYFVPEKHRGDPEINDEDEGFATYRGEEIDFADHLRGQLALYYPMRFLCREDCKGICQRCGADLNNEPCKCAAAAGDPRWDALKKLKL